MAEQRILASPGAKVASALANGSRLAPTSRERRKRCLGESRGLARSLKIGEAPIEAHVARVQMTLELRDRVQVPRSSRLVAAVGPIQETP